MKEGGVQRHYDSLDAVYRVVWGESLHHGVWETGRESRAEAIANHQELVMTAVERNGAPKRVVDIGCGYGVLSRLMWQRWAAEVYGVTNSMQQWSWCEDEEGLYFSFGEWEAIEIHKLFDAATAVEVTGHVQDLDRFFAVTAERVATDGVFVIADFFRTERISASTRQKLERDGRFTELRRLCSLVAAAEANGWRLERRQDLTELVAPTWVIMWRRLWSKAWISPSMWKAAIRAPRDLRLGAVPRMIRAYQNGGIEYAVLEFRRIKS